MTFTGRAAELEALVACRRPGLVLVEGEAGVGKTALIEHWLAGVPVLRAAGDGVVDQLERRGAPPDLICATVLFVDDAHWADEPSLAVLARAARRTTGLIVTAARPGTDLEALARAATLRLWLDPLPPDELEPISGVSLSDAAARRLWTDTGGDLRLALALPTEFPATTWGDFEHRLPAPRDLTAGVARRLDACTEHTRRLVEAAAVLRGACRLADAATVGGLTTPAGAASPPPLGTSASPAPAGAPASGAASPSAPAGAPASGASAPPGATAPCTGAASPPASDGAALAALEEALGAGLLRERGPHTLVFTPPVVGAAVHARLGPVRRAGLHRGAVAVVEDETAALLHLGRAAPGPDGVLAERLDARARRSRERPEAARALVAASPLSPTREQREDRLVRAVDWMLSG